MACSQAPTRLKLAADARVFSDIRYAFRTLRRAGISTVIAVLSLAIGIGANAAIFSVGYAMLARPLPYPGADRLVMLRPMNPSHGLLCSLGSAGGPP